MASSQLFLGIDLGTSGVKIAVINESREVIHSEDKKYRRGVEFPNDWRECCTKLIGNLEIGIKRNILGISVDGTSGTLLACDKKGNPIGQAIPYYVNHKNKKFLQSLNPKKEDTINSNNSLFKALYLINKYGESILLRHQADWITGWLINDWSSGEAGNNIKLGWDVTNKSWPSSFEQFTWLDALPSITESGSLLGYINYNLAKHLGLNETIQIFSGTTDSNAAVLAADLTQEDGATILGSTIVIKRFVDSPLKGAGVTNHLIGHRWLAGGASNAGCKVLGKFFNDKDLKELSNQINPKIDSGITLIPLPSTGERFPYNDPKMAPILEPRPISDALYLHALLEGLTKIEAAAWEKLIELGATPPKQIITLGGGANNPQWRRLRQRIIGIPIKTCKSPPAKGVAIIALEGFLTNN